MAINDYIKKMLDSAKIRKGRVDLQKGVYEATILGLTYERREKREKLGKAVWIDVVIDEAEAAEGAAPGEVPNEVGSELSFPILLEGQYAEMNFADLKTFLAELTGCAPEEVSAKWEELVDTVTDEGKHSNTSQPARGMKVLITTFDRAIKTGKNAGKVRTFPRWHHAEQTPADVVKRRAALEVAKAA